jgi:hypothetical protein
LLADWRELHRARSVSCSWWLFPGETGRADAARRVDGAIRSVEYRSYTIQHPVSMDVTTRVDEALNEFAKYGWSLDRQSMASDGSCLTVLLTFRRG